MTTIETLSGTRQRICPNCDTPADLSCYSLLPEQSYTCLRCGFRATADQWRPDEMQSLN